jgi:hypothetical protein
MDWQKRSLSVLSPGCQLDPSSGSTRLVDELASLFSLREEIREKVRVLLVSRIDGEQVPRRPLMEGTHCHQLLSDVISRLND